MEIVLNVCPHILDFVLDDSKRAYGIGVTLFLLNITHGIKGEACHLSAFFSYLLDKFGKIFSRFLGNVDFHVFDMTRMSHIAILAIGDAVMQGVSIDKVGTLAFVDGACIPMPESSVSLRIK